MGGRRTALTPGSQRLENSAQLGAGFGFMPIPFFLDLFFNGLGFSPFLFESRLPLSEHRGLMRGPGYVFFSTKTWDITSSRIFFFFWTAVGR